MRIRLATTALAILLAGCADAPTAPTAPSVPRGPSLALASSEMTVAGLTRDVPFESDRTYTFTVGTAGGSFALTGTGLRIDVPANALPTKRLTITVTASAGDMVAYNFEPHGTVFRKPLTLSQSTRGTSYWRLKDPAAVEAGYFAHSEQLDESANTAVVNEVLPVSVDSYGSQLRFNAEHFSGYMLSSGRKILE